MRRMLDDDVLHRIVIPVVRHSVGRITDWDFFWAFRCRQVCILIPLFKSAAVAATLVNGGVLQICTKVFAATADEGAIEDLWLGQQAVLLSFCNLAQHPDLRPQLAEVMPEIPMDKLLAHENAGVREAAARLDFELREAPEATGDSLPPEILARGAKAEALYQQALKEGTAKTNWAKVVFLGEDRAGKTSVLAALAGDMWESDTESTHGVATSCYRLGAKGWKAEPAGTYHGEVLASSVAACMKRDQEEQEKEDKDEDKEEDNNPQTESREAAKETAGGKKAIEGPSAPKSTGEKRASQTTASKNVSALGATDVPIDLIANALAADGTSLRVVCQDTAGQPRYYSMLARSLTRGSAPVLVLSLTRWARFVLKRPEFADYDVDLQLNCAGRATGDSEEESTLGSELVFFRYWLSMILVRTCDETLVHIVGTHFDGVWKTAKGDNALITSLLEQLSSIVTDVARSVGVLNRIQACQSGFGKDTLIFPVDNSGSAPGDGVAILRGSLFESLSESASAGPLAKEIPISWVKLLDALKAIAAERPYATITEITHIAEHYEILKATDEAEEQVRQALTYFNNTGDIVYVGGASPNLRHVAFVDPECLALAQANILDCPRAVKRMNEEALCLHKGGVLHEKLLGEIWTSTLFKKLDAQAKRTYLAGPRTSNEPIDRKQTFTDFLVSDDFLVPIHAGSTRELWVPSLLPVWQRGEPTAPAMFETLQDEPPLESTIFVDLKGILLPEFFPKLVAGLVSSKGFELLDTSPPNLYRNAAQLFTTFGTITAVLRPPASPSELAVCASQLDTGDEPAFIVFQAITNVLQSVVKAISWNFSERTVIGPAVMEGGQCVIMAISELTQNADKVKLTTRCRQLPGRRLASEDLPPWLRELLFPGLDAASASGASIQAVYHLRKARAGSVSREARSAEEADAADAPEVEGLARLFADCKLPPKMSLAAAKWCEENMVVDIKEILTDFDDFASSLGLKKIPEARLKTALVRMCNEPEDGQSGSDDDRSSTSSTEQSCTDKFLVLTFGTAKEAALGIEALLGISQEERVAGEAKKLDAIREEVQTAGSKDDKDNLRYILDGVAQQKDHLPEQVVRDYEKGCYHGGRIEDGDYDRGHTGMTFEDFMQHEYVKLAKLSEPEVCAIRLYTTSTYRLYNNPLRQKRNNRQRHPLAMTVYFMVKGLQRLRAVAADRPGFAKKEELWRGLKDARLADVDKFMEEGGAELAPMSTTTSFDVASRYAKSGQPFLFRYTAKGMSKGVYIDFLSVYPLEKECLYPPGTYLNPSHRGGSKSTKKRLVHRVEATVVNVEPQWPTV